MTRKGDQVSWWERGESSGVCRAESGCKEKGEHVSAATGNVASDKTGPLVSWPYCKEDANKPQDLVACLLGTAASWGALDMGRGEAGQVVAAVQPYSQGLSCDGMWAGVATSSHIPM